jgi:hypothetical protein
MNKKQRWAGRKTRKRNREYTQPRAVFVETTTHPHGAYPAIFDPDLNLYKIRKAAADALPERGSIVILKWAGSGWWRIKK